MTGNYFQNLNSITSPTINSTTNQVLKQILKYAKIPIYPPMPFPLEVTRGGASAKQGSKLRKKLAWDS